MDGTINGGLIGVILGMAGSLAGSYVLGRLRAQTARGLADQIISSAHREADAIRLQAELAAKEAAFQQRQELDREVDQARKEAREQERRLEKRSDLLDQKLELIGRKERDFEVMQRTLADQHEELQKRQQEVRELISDQREALHRIGRMSLEEARDLLLRRVREELASDVGTLIMQHESAARETCQQRSREILTTAIQRYAASHTAEVTVSTVDIPSDEMKGRIIGREGRNIRAFEKATGVDVIVDDTPGVVVVTGFDSVRREIAKVALEKLIQDGRIHPTRIEEIVQETREEMEEHIRRLGREAASEADVPELHEKLLDYLGRLKFRTSYSQNVLRHSIEVGFLTGMMAEEIGLDGALGRRCGLLHDIGKAADHEMEGGHPAVGAELARRYGEGPEVVHAALGHHDDLRVDRPYTVLVAAADAISASRPGARRETLDKYVRRLEELEALALGFPGVEHAYAIQAGREVRVLVDSQLVDDAAAAALCRDVARAIQEQLTYPGEVKVTVLRETRAVEFAR
ncbi:Ribonuclease Y [Aquisphaera giovannonii]|uniref:Ribonuclease Y n=1 Tax=Aquisphaera giovannonii TaxID=406548 RepID=A0A5B9W174_9BACT|nr:ribonuclease Y [Aquisphaera giovannonii]QEH33720.1 Ribonuclease Y [Aquisphaera giovannonii]